MINIDELKARLQPHNVVDICYHTGLSQGTIYGILSGRNDNPSYRTIVALDQFLRERESELSREGKKA